VDAHGGQNSGRILLVDDEKAVLEVTRMILEHFGFNVLTARGGQEACIVFEEHAAEIQVVVLDLTMPDMSGVEVFKRLRLHRSEVPVLFASGYTENSMPAELANQPCTGFLQKPYQAAGLLAKVQTLIRPAS
jgi:DNA-binding response OmpR family regulator